MARRPEWQQVSARDRELFPPLVRRSVLVALWIVLAVVLGALVWITVAVGAS